jgi:hypothetical protein
MGDAYEAMAATDRKAALTAFLKSQQEDERIIAWERIAKHPFFLACYDAEEPLIDAMISLLDDANSKPRRLTRADAAFLATDLEDLMAEFPDRAFDPRRREILERLRR